MYAAWLKTANGMQYITDSSQHMLDMKINAIIRNNSHAELVNSGYVDLEKLRKYPPRFI